MPESKNTDSWSVDTARPLNTDEEKGSRLQPFSEDFCAAMDSTMQPIYIIDPESFEILYCNQAMCHSLRKNPTGGLCYRDIRGMDAPCPNCSAMKLYREGSSEQREFFHPLGIWVLLQASPLDWRGRRLIKVACMDITRQKQMEAELRLRNQEYAAVVRQSVQGIMRYDIAEDQALLNVNDNLERTEEQSIPHFSQYILHSRIVTEASVEAAQRILDDIQRGLPSQGYSLRLSLENEGLRWIHVDYVLIKADRDKSDRAVVFFYDNTEQREKELAYQSWSARLSALVDEHTAYIEVNLSQDQIEAEGRIGSWNSEASGRHFSDYVAEAAALDIYIEDIREFRHFLNRERLLGQFYSGQKEDSLEYRALVEQKPQWYRAELQLVSDPVSGDIKAAIAFNNVDADVRERERLTREAERDALTGLYNRATVERRINQYLEQNPGELCCFLIIDLDDLREINSSLGHPEGDRALRAIAGAMQARFRESDILGRIGGDEFVALMKNVPEGPGLNAVISGFMQKLRELPIGPLNDRSIHASVGATVGTAGKEDFRALYRQADLALYYTKARGKNNFSFYVPEMEGQECIYQPRSTVTMTRAHCYESTEFRKLLQAMAAFFPLVISVNLTKNTYYMMEYMAYTTQKARDEGSYDELIEVGASAFHPEDQESFLNSFRREKLLRDYAEGRRIVGHRGRQLGDDGIYRTVRTVVYLLEDEGTGDICEITLAHVTPPETEDLE